MKLGVTGGIGSGKTTVCRIFSILGIPVFYADTEAKILMEQDAIIIERINAAANRNVYSNGKLDRVLLASLIFNDSDLLGRINSIVHPPVFKKFTDWAKLQTSPYSILEAAILFESNATQYVDRTLTVSAPAEERIMRVMRRNEMSRSQVLDRIKNQYDDAWREERADYIIRNSEHDMIIQSVLDIHQELIKNIK